MTWIGNARFSLAICAALLLGVFSPLRAELPRAEFPLWATGAPGATGTTPKDIPTLTPFYPASEKATGAGMGICPGGGYGGLANYEEADYAKWLNEQGITAFVPPRGLAQKIKWCRSV